MFCPKPCPPSKGKWADNKFFTSSGYYPKYANGASGYILSTDLAKYIADNKDDLYPYANEDASLGIWLDRSPINKAGELNYFNVGFGEVKRILKMA